MQWKPERLLSSRRALLLTFSPWLLPKSLRAETFSLAGARKVDLTYSDTSLSRSFISGFRTSRDLAFALVPISPLPLTKRQEKLAQRRGIIVDRKEVGQPFIGVGAALTASTCFLLRTHLAPTQRTAFLHECFGTNGFSTVRICMGDSDYVPRAPFQTYDDVAGDTSLTHFSVARDLEYVIPTIQDALSINPGLKIIAAPWSPPAYMKTNDALTGSGAQFKATTADMTVYADYFVEFVRAYASHGIPIWAVSVQNEPNFSPPNYPGCIWQPEDAATFIGSHLGPAFAAAGITTRILVGDASWRDTGGLVTTPLASATAKRFIFGAAYHGYYGSALKQAQDMSANPSKTIHMTEYCPSIDSTIANELAAMAGNQCVSAIRYGASSITLWNLCTNAAGGPSPSTACRGAVYLATDGSGTISRNAGFYMLAHLGRFLKAGARRCASTTFAEGSEQADVQSVAFTNPDGQIILFLFNNAPDSRTVTVKDASSRLGSEVTLAAGDMQTLTWAS